MHSDPTDPTNPTNPRPFKMRALGITGGAMAIALAAGGVAYATTPSSTSTSTKTPASALATPATRPQRLAARRIVRRDVRRLMHRTVHGTLIVATKAGYETVEVDKGKLTSVSGTTIEITRPDGPTVDATITSTTRFVGIAQSALAPGDGVVIVQTGGNALLIGARAPRSATGTRG